MSVREPTLRERTRRAVQREIAEAALGLFVARGYDATTTEDIAAAAGLSQRSVFRYFAAKDEILLGKVDLVVGDLLDLVRARPAGEPVWTSLRRGFDVFGVPYHPEYAAPILRLVFGTPVLLAGYLRKLQEAQETVVALLVQRAEAAGTPYAPGDPAPRALTAAAFGCLVAAHYSWLESGAEGPFEAAIDRAMDAVRPPA